MKNLNFLFGIILTCGFAFSQELYSQWGFYRNITVNTSPAGANVTGNVTKFPVLVRLTPADTFTGIAANGADIRFTKADGVSRLKHQTERFDAVNKVAEFWVLLDTVYGNNSTQTIRMFWGKSGAADSSNGRAVFETANGFQGVWHLGEATGSAANDATTNNFHGTAGNTGTFTNNSFPFDTSAVVGRGKSLRMNAGTSGAYFVMDGTASGSATTAGATNILSFAEAGPYTISTWVRVYNNTTSGMLVTKGDGYYQLSKRTGGSVWEFIHSNGTRPGGASSAIGAANVGVWKHLVGVRSAVGDAGAALYIDGLPVLFEAANETATLNQTFPFTLGRDPGSTANRYLTGALDEVTVANSARSADWIKLSYETQKIGATSVVNGPAQIGIAVPGAPTAVMGTAGNAQVSVSWTAPASNGGGTITAYTATSSPGNLTCGTTGTLTCTVFGLTNNLAYTFTVTATNVAGVGPASAPSAAVTPVAVLGVPGQPPAIVTTPGNAQAVVAWSAPGSPGSSPISGYTVTSNPDAKTCTTTGALTCTVTTLTNGTPYTFTVVASNASGSSIASPSSSPVTPVGPPSAPAAPTGTAGNTQATVAWIAPSNGGSVITGYTVTAAPGGATCTTTGAVTCLVNGLINGTSYTFTVLARNTVGPGPASPASTAIIPLGVPGAPTNVAGVAGTGLVTVSWVAPTITGGSPITGYTATSTTGNFTCSSTGLSCTVTGLSAGTPYSFTVSATNVIGTGVASAPSAPVTTGILGFVSKNGLEIRSAGSSVVFRLPSTPSDIQISVMDIWGRTVWSQRVGAGASEVTWNGKGNGGGAVRGVYLVRITTMNLKPQILAESKVMVLP